MASEILEIIPVSNDHNSTGSGIDKRDYTYTEHNITTHGYPSYAGTVAKPGTIKGGLLSVDYDTEELGGGALQMSLFLFDADGNPYKHTGYADGSGATYFGDDDVGFIGELYEPTYVDPAPEDNPAVVNAGYSYGSLLGPFTTKIPDGCTVMVYVRCVTYPCGNFADRIALGQWLYEGGITFTVSDYVEEDTNDPEDDTDGSGATTDYPTNFWPYLNVLGVVGKEIPCLTGSGAPGKGTPGGVGSLYMNTVNGKVYKCTAVTDGVYTWKALTSSSSGSGTSYSVPEYWKDHLDTKIETIKSLQAGKDCFSFIVHANTTCFIQIEHFFNVIIISQFFQRRIMLCYQCIDNRIHIWSLTLFEFASTFSSESEFVVDSLDFRKTGNTISFINQFDNANNVS